MKKGDISEVGRILRELRFMNDESIEDMANKLGLSNAVISLIGGGQVISSKTALKVISLYKLEGEEKERFVNAVTNSVVNKYWGKAIIR